MKITIECTDQITRIDGVPVRIWKGVTESGVECVVMVHRLAVELEQDASQFDRELKAMPVPRDVPLHQVLTPRLL